MHSLKKVLFALLVGLAGMFVLTAPASAAASAPQQLGGLELGAYCRSLGHGDAVLTGATAYDWHCVAADGRQTDLAFDAACRWTYGAGDVVDRIADFRDPASVSCWRVQSSVVVPDLDRYCAAAGRSGAELRGDTVYDWSCVQHSRGGPTYYDVSLPEVCRATVSPVAIDRFANFNDPRSWQCRV